MHQRRRIALALALLCAPPTLAKEPLDLVPAESMLCWHGRPFPDTSPAGQDRSALQVLLELGTQIIGEPLQNKAKLAGRVVELYSTLITYPHAVALIDAEAKALESNPRARRVTNAQAALIADVGGKPEPFLRIIQATINDVTDSANATLEQRSVGRFTYHELQDKRLPPWAGISWGMVDDYFVLAAGEGAWPKIAALAEGTTGLTRDPWINEVRGRRSKKALIEIIVASRGIRDGLDPFVDGRASAFFEAWNAGSIERAHWALGFEGQALFCEASFLRDGQTTRRLFADPDEKDTRLLAVVPEQARWAVYRLPPRDVVPRLVKSLLATRGSGDRELVARLWAELEARHTFNAERDLLGNLGDAIVLHNDPPHPLRIPLAMTGLIEIRQNPQDVRRCLDALCAEWKTLLERHAQRTGIPSLATLERDGDAWYVKVGVIAGPAWTVTDRFIVTSWSPLALQTYLEKMGERAGKKLPAGGK